MNITVNNSYKVVNALQSKGFTKEQSEGIVDVLETVDFPQVLTTENLKTLATKKDVETLKIALKKDIETLKLAFKKDIEMLRLEFKSDIAELKTGMLKYVTTLVVSIAAIQITIIGLMFKFL